MCLHTLVSQHLTRFIIGDTHLKLAFINEFSKSECLMPLWEDKTEIQHSRLREIVATIKHSTQHGPICVVRKLGWCTHVAECSESLTMPEQKASPR